MPKKKKSHKGKKSGSHKRGHRMGVIKYDTHGQELIQMAAGTVVGAVAKRLGDTLIQKQAATTGVEIKQKTVDLVETAGSAIAFYYFDQPFIRGFALGVGSTAAVSALHEMDVIKGIGMNGNTGMPLVPFRPRPLLNGVTQTPAVAGANAYMFPKPAGVAGATARRYAGGNMR